MDINELIKRFSNNSENQSKAIFNTIFIVANRLQTIFDHHIPDMTLKQFMLLTMIKQADQPQTLTALGEILGCSRQNVKKLALSLQAKGFVTIENSTVDPRAVVIVPNAKIEQYFNEDFMVYQQQLHYLFDIYSSEEMNQLFNLMMKLYQGIENLKEKTEKNK